MINIASSKGKDSTFKEREQFFNSHIDRNVFDSLHSYTKFSSLGGTHSIDKKRRKLKNTESFKKKRGKPNSSKKSEKARSSSGPFADPVVMKNYRSANLTSNPVKIVNAKQADNSKQRYQYHKRIRSDTGNTVITPLEQVYDRNQILNEKKVTNPSFHKAKTDISTPLVASEEQRASVIEKKHPSNFINISNTIQVNKYDFAPSFTHHKNISLDSNAQYRKFKSNKNSSNAHKIDSAKIKKPHKYKIQEKRGQSEEESYPTSKGGDSRKASKHATINHDEYALEYSPKKTHFQSVVKEVSISDIADHEDLIEETVNEYRYESRGALPEIQTKVQVKQSLQLAGDRSVSMSKETDEMGRHSDARTMTISPDYVSRKYMSKKSSGEMRESEEPEHDYDRYYEMNIRDVEHEDSKRIEMLSQSQDEPKPSTKVVQIDCNSLNPLETTKSKDELVSYIKNAIRENGKEPETKARFYRVGKLLGRGAFGKVSLGMHKVTNQLVAIKSINKEFLEEERSRRKVAKEVAILKKLQHENIINLYETFETEKHFLLVTELCPGGDLLNYVRRRRKLTEDVAKYFFKQLVEACIYCHKKGVVHRDIKLDNILLDHKGNLKLGDFGVSRVVK